MKDFELRGVYRFKILKCGQKVFIFIEIRRYKGYIAEMPVFSKPSDVFRHDRVFFNLEICWILF
jgi:hypothetical protein